MRLLLTISLLFSLLIGHAQQTTIRTRNMTTGYVPTVTVTRALFDLGGNGVADDADGAGSNPAIQDTGVMTPSNALPNGTDANGRRWNNIVDCRAGTWISNPVDTAGNVITGLSISSDKEPGGNFSNNDYSMNFAGTIAAVNDYPATAVRDNCFFDANSGVVTLNIVIPAGSTATIKFWGNRATTGTARILEFKLSTSGTYTQEYDALNNLTYTQAATFSNLSGTVQINIRCKSGSSFGHISVIDLSLTTTQ